MTTEPPAATSQKTTPDAITTKLTSRPTPVATTEPTPEPTSTQSPKGILMIFFLKLVGT